MPARCGIRSRQFARSGEPSGAVTILKSMAPSALVRMNSSSPRSATEYCTPSSRAATRRGGASGSARSISRCSEVSWSPPAITQNRPLVALMQMREPAGILLFIDQNVVGLLRAEPMAPDLHRAMVVVELDVEEALAVLAPDHAAVGLLDESSRSLPLVPVAHADREIFRAVGVGAPCLQPVVGRMPAAAELEIVAGPRRARRRRARSRPSPPFARHAAEQLVLAALAEFAEIGVRAVGRGHAGIVLLDAAAHLRDQRLLQGAVWPSRLSA